jgi:hypothetical protein
VPGDQRHTNQNNADAHEIDEHEFSPSADAAIVNVVRLGRFLVNYFNVRDRAVIQLRHGRDHPSMR